MQRGPHGGVATWAVLGLLALTAVSLLGAYGKRGLDRYVREDAQFCKSCHEDSPALAMWTSDAHSRISCQSCHVIEDDQIYAMLIASVSGSHGDPKLKAAATNVRCESCHLSPDKRQEPEMASPGHLQHTRSGLVPCLKCHGSRVHRIVRPEEVCADCHRDMLAASRPDRMNEMHCPSCHNFLDAEATIFPSRRDCQSCHDQRRVAVPPFPADGHMAKLPCFACHEPHRSADPGDACLSCHVHIEDAPAYQKHQAAACQACHAPHGFTASIAACKSHHAGGLDYPLVRSAWRDPDRGAAKDAWQFTPRAKGPSR